MNGLGLAILQLKGVMSDTEARKNVGGEIICRVF